MNRNTFWIGLVTPTVVILGAVFGSWSSLSSRLAVLEQDQQHAKVEAAKFATREVVELQLQTVRLQLGALEQRLDSK